MDNHIKEIVSSLPSSPGVYQYFDKEGTIIYVGKAKNLKRRVSSYFQKEHTSRKTQQLVNSIADLKYIVVNSEQDAFLLENNLIKKHQPRYNILLKDGKSYPSICITRETYPRIFKTRKIIKGIGEYYGPYSFGNTVDLVLELIHDLYPLRTCKMQMTEEGVMQNKYKVCLKYHIHKCCGICEGYKTREEYLEYIRQIRKIIQGDAHEISDLLLQEMAELSQQMRFEEAQKLKEKYNLIERFKSKTIITNTHIQDTDVFGYEENGEDIYVSMLKIHNGAIVQGNTVEYRRIVDEEKEEILGRAIMELRSQTRSLSRNIIVPFIPDFIDERIEYTIPQRGDSKKILDLAIQNVRQYKADKLRQSDKLNPDQRNARILSRLQEMLHLEKIPAHIECFDNSSIQGSSAVAGCVVFKMGKPDKQSYKRFNISEEHKQDDYAAMREVTFRRYKRLIEENGELPDLIIADGGIGQMHAIQEATEGQLDLQIPIAGLVKNDKHRTTTLLYGFPPKEVELRPTDEVFHLLTRIQDEVHRFAISFHRQKRSKAQTASELDNIPGIGPQSKKALLQTFKSIKRLKESDLKDIAAIVGNSRASVIYEYFHGKISV
ncbi:MAG: excinuclease ABC subunit UvrC [Paludibacter sp.]|nr:excinuclease ABC subunit UvrC [Bacteroidales bacterium]MCM1068538.1 excinuclease ABC subunit UvrC [Prevotella sp.]MCM1353202.1 excinuclease ABC subunit UvrC [Bacteroides sp.]MCM1442390.1 excinuclease ABC subunit UvrC [Muribaculum sp.]MCM1481209.1 excinuclease ABC subunit UvrC [Paludibacter sp.]